MKTAEVCWSVALVGLVVAALTVSPFFFIGVIAVGWVLIDRYPSTL